MRPTVGFIGLGNMGAGMATNLLEHGFPLVVYDVRAEAVERMIAKGADAAEGPRALGERVDTVVVMVLNFPQMEEVILGADGVASTLKPGATVIGSSTISPNQARSLGAALAERRIKYVDAPVSGGKARATDGTLTIMVGADEEVFAAQQPVLAAMSANLYHCGPIGTGQTAKMCNQLMAGVTLAATAECLALGAAAGIDLRRLYEIITHGTGDGWMFRNRADRMMAGDFETRGRLEIFLKDLGIVLESADQQHLPLLVTSAARQLMTMAAAEGYATEDDSAVVKVLEKFSGVSVKVS
jgi:putative dehydrogenase